MGENKHIKELDAFTKKYIQEIEPEKTSLNFTANLMQKINEVEVKTVFKSTPLIPKKVWVFITTIFVALLFIPFNKENKSLLNLPELDLSVFSKFQVSGLLESFSVSNSTFYGFLLFGIMVFIQIIYLKKHFESKLD